MVCTLAVKSYMIFVFPLRQLSAEIPRGSKSLACTSMASIWNVGAAVVLGSTFLVSRYPSSPIDDRCKARVLYKSFKFPSRSHARIQLAPFCRGCRSAIRFPPLLRQVQFQAFQGAAGARSRLGPSTTRTFSVSSSAAARGRSESKKALGIFHHYMRFVLGGVMQ